VVDLFCAHGTWDVIASRIEERFGGLSDSIGFQTAAGEEPSLIDPGVLQDIQKIGTTFRGYDLNHAV